jgi:hypothetical protein
MTLFQTMRNALAGTLGLILSVNLIVLLVQREFARSGSKRSQEWAWALQAAIVPLLLVFALTMFIQFSADTAALGVAAVPSAVATAAPAMAATAPARATSVPTTLPTVAPTTTTPASRPNPPAAAQPDPAGRAIVIAYSVQRGDTLSALALRFGTDVATLIALNPQVNPDSLVVGHVLSVPALQQEKQP